MNTKFVAAVLLVIGLSLLTQTSTTQVTTAAQSQRSTLPPSWTPSPTATETATGTATQIASATSTASAGDVCAGFELLYDFSAQNVYSTTGYIPILLQLNDPEAMIRFSAVNTESGEGNGFELPGGQAIAMEFRVSALPGPGDYDWHLAVISEIYGELCAQDGHFTVLAPTATPAADLATALTRFFERLLDETP